MKNEGGLSINISGVMFKDITSIKLSNCGVEIMTGERMMACYSSQFFDFDLLLKPKGGDDV